MVRGLDYYERTAWEWVIPGGGSQAGTISGGGRYDGLAEQIGGERVPGVGFGCGTERVVLALEDAGVEAAAAASWTGSAPARTTRRDRRCTRCSSRRARAGSRARPISPDAASRASCATPSGCGARVVTRLPRRRRRAWHRQARRGRDRLRRCRRLRRAERARTRERLQGHAVRRAARRARGPRADALGLGRRAARSRRARLHRPARPHGHRAARDGPRARARRRTPPRRRCGSSASCARGGELVPRSEATRNDQLPTGDVELAVDRARAALLERGAAVPARRRERRRGAAHPPSLPRPAPSENAGIAGHSHARGALDPPLPGRARTSSTSRRRR